MAPNLKKITSLVNIVPKDTLLVNNSKYPTLDATIPQQQQQQQQQQQKQNDPNAINPAFDTYWATHSQDASSQVGLKAEHDNYWESSECASSTSKPSVVVRAQHDAYWDTPAVAVEGTIKSQQVNDKYWESPGTTKKGENGCSSDSYWEVVSEEANMKVNPQAAKNEHDDYWREDNDLVLSTAFIVSRLVADSKKMNACSREVEVVRAKNQDEDMWEWNVDRVRPMDSYWEMSA